MKTIKDNNTKDKVYIYCELAHFYQYVRLDIGSAISHYELAIKEDNNSLVPLYNLGLLYQSELKDYGKMKNLYDLVIEKSNNTEDKEKEYYYITCVTDMINYYKCIEKDDLKMKEYQDKLSKYYLNKYKSATATAYSSSDIYKNLDKTIDSVYASMKSLDKLYSDNYGNYSNTNDMMYGLMSKFRYGGY